MKRYLLFFAGFAISCAVHAAPPVAEAPIRTYGTPTTVAISSTTLTKIPTSQTSGRIGIFIGLPTANTGDMVGFMGNCTSTALANTLRPLKFIPAAGSAFFPIREDICLWLITTNTSASTENIHYQEVMQ